MSETLESVAIDVDHLTRWPVEPATYSIV